jgi:hypothetical protein
LSPRDCCGAGIAKEGFNAKVAKGAKIAEVVKMGASREAHQIQASAKVASALVR